MEGKPLPEPWEETQRRDPFTQGQLAVRTTKDGQMGRHKMAAQIKGKLKFSNEFLVQWMKVTSLFIWQASAASPELSHYSSVLSWCCLFMTHLECQGVSTPTIPSHSHTRHRQRHRHTHTHTHTHSTVTDRAVREALGPTGGTQRRKSTFPRWDREVGNFRHRSVDG